MSDAAPPAWVKRAPGLASSYKFLLMVLWGYGPARRTGPKDPLGGREPGRPVVVWATREALAEATGQPMSTLKNQLAKLVADGWIMRLNNGARTVLSWRTPHTYNYGWVAVAGRRTNVVEVAS